MHIVHKMTRTYEAHYVNVIMNDCNCKNWLITNSQIFFSYSIVIGQLLEWILRYIHINLHSHINVCIKKIIQFYVRFYKRNTIG